LVPSPAVLGELQSGQLNNVSVPPPPAWVQKVPMVGTKIDTAWREVSTGQVDLSTKIQPYLRPIAAWLGRKAGSFLALVVQLIVIVIAAGILYANGEIAANGVRRFAERLAGERGDKADRAGGTGHPWCGIRSGGDLRSCRQR
jgi:predicted PurR-regulated permease PerM